MSDHDAQDGCELDFTDEARTDDQTELLLKALAEEEGASDAG